MNTQTSIEELQESVTRLFAQPPSKYSEDDQAAFRSFRQLLSDGVIRAAEPDETTAIGWRVNTWVKQGILLGFRMGGIVDMSPSDGGFRFFDKSTYPLRSINLSDQVRIVPGGSSIRAGSYIGRGVTCMPPMYVNVGAYVDDGTMIDSHALVGSCAQIGKRCHLSAAAQIGGVLEPVGLLPVIIEDDVLVGGNCGVYEGTVVKKGAVLSSGTILNRSMPVYDLVREKVYRADDSTPLVIPEHAVVVSGSRHVNKSPGKEWGISLYTPVIVKYRDSVTEAKIQLEDLLR